MNSLSRKLAIAGAAATMTMAGVACATPSDTVDSSATATTLAQSTPSSSAPGATSTPSSTPSQSTAAPSSASPPSPSASTTGGMSNDTSGSTAASSAGTTSQDVEARKIFDQLDTNHDGTLSFDEFSRATFRAK